MPEIFEIYNNNLFILKTSHSLRCLSQIVTKIMLFCYILLYCIFGPQKTTFRNFENSHLTDSQLLKRRKELHHFSEQWGFQPGLCLLPLPPADADVADVYIPHLLAGVAQIQVQLWTFLWYPKALLYNRTMFLSLNQVY